MGPTPAELHGILRAFDLPTSSEVKLIRRGTNFVYLVEDVEAILRVTTADSVDDLRKQINVVKQLSEVALVLPPLSEKVAVSGCYAATLWAKGEVRQGKEAFAGLGNALKSLWEVDPHEVDWADFGRVDLLGRAKRRLETLKTLTIPARHIDFLECQISDLTLAHDALVSEGNSLIHGDAYIGNLVFYEGQYLLIDMDNLCIGKPEIDLVPTKVEADRFARVEEFKALERGARKSLSKWYWSKDACRIRELTMVTWLGTLWDVDQNKRDQFLLRMATLMDISDHRQWESV